MPDSGSLEAVLSELTLEHLSDTILTLSESQPDDQRSAVNMPTIMEALLAGRDLGSGSKGWSAQLALKRAVISTVKAIPEMRFVAGDA